MVLTLTKYIDAEPGNVAQKLEGVVGHGLQAAATRIGADRNDLRTEAIIGGLRLNGGLCILDGSELLVGGQSRLTTLTITVPWNTTDNAKLLAAGAFAEAIAAEVQLAA